MFIFITKSRAFDKIMFPKYIQLFLAVHRMFCGANECKRMKWRSRGKGGAL